MLLEIAQTAEFPKSTIAALAWLPTEQIDQKREDADKLLKQLASGCDQKNSELKFKFEYTTLWDNVVGYATRLDYRGIGTHFRIFLQPPLLPGFK